MGNLGRYKHRREEENLRLCRGTTESVINTRLLPLFTEIFQEQRLKLLRMTVFFRGRNGVDSSPDIPLWDVYNVETR
jgi:hypothetical protein